MSDYSEDEILLGKIFWGERPHSLYMALEKDLVPPEYMEEARRILNRCPYPREPSWSIRMASFGRTVCPDCQREYYEGEEEE